MKRVIALFLTVLIILTGCIQQAVQNPPSETSTPTDLQNFSEPTSESEQTPAQDISVFAEDVEHRIAMKTYLRMELKEDLAANSAEKRRTHIAFRRFGKAVAVAAITITLLFSTAMVANAQFREKVIAWVVETFEKYSIFELQSDGENTARFAEL